MEPTRGRNDNFFLDDKESRRQLLYMMPQELRDEYNSYKFVAKEAAFPGRVLVVYTLENGRPVNLDIVTLLALTVGQESGPISYASSEGQGSYPIGMVPTKWRGRDLFVQLPLEFIFKWRGKEVDEGVNFAPCYAILIKTKSRWDEWIEGHTYCATLNDFRERFPAVPVRY
jgi:hypothetical protein